MIILTIGAYNSACSIGGQVMGYSYAIKLLGNTIYSDYSSAIGSDEIV